MEQAVRKTAHRLVSRGSTLRARTSSSANNNNNNNNNNNDNKDNDNNNNTTDDNNNDNNDNDNNDNTNNNRNNNNNNNNKINNNNNNTHERQASRRRIGGEILITRSLILQGTYGESGAKHKWQHKCTGRLVLSRRASCSHGALRVPREKSNTCKSTAAVG
ncbi:unnamed protein product [Polarella glacialis]|uniref:Uncharacterized protein n=1 Tax=Polarella glacialis TaxID=89957 RepID=A0A813DD93_POLGL|nr:unnamed protein product [Polarella glacialis]